MDGPNYVAKICIVIVESELPAVVLIHCVIPFVDECVCHYAPAGADDTCSGVPEQAQRLLFIAGLPVRAMVADAADLLLTSNSRQENIPAGVCEDSSCKEVPIDLLQSRVKGRGGSADDKRCYNWPACVGDACTTGETGKVLAK